MDTQATAQPVPASQPAEQVQIPTVGRILHAYSDRWSGPRPAVVVNAFGGSVANVKVLFDGVNDRDAVEAARLSGSTFPSVHVFGPLAVEERTARLAEANVRDFGCGKVRIICEWPVR